ncbi:hypothetical protein [Parathalassolituus penaei]|uniref:Uncharacterized protein n=1 Tax=Parathalassolituus penaei TaxID=2997323 RepID=A0A9X3EJ28_9GAMM|nr:hypothetical protein [Parathalassolituus penaei]MCY0965161.1 hypothetical protein [Parathalassolituus penaei]
MDNGKVLLAAGVLAVIGFIWAFLKFRVFREFLYALTGFCLILTTIEAVLNGETWFLSISKFELIAFWIVGYLFHSNQKHYRTTKNFIYKSAIRDLINIGIPVFYVTMPIITIAAYNLIAYTLLNETEALRSLELEEFIAQISDTDISTWLLVFISTTLAMRNISLRVKAKNTKLPKNTQSELNSKIDPTTTTMDTQPKDAFKKPESSAFVASK